MNLDIMDSSFALLIENPKDKQALKDLNNAVNREFGIEANIDIIKNDTDFFGMNVYPSEDVLSELIVNILNKNSAKDKIYKLWENNKKWYIEIDSRLLDSRELNATPSECTAILLHEIGHIIKTFEVPYKVNKLLKYQLMELNFSIKHLLCQSKLRSIFNMVVVDACTIKNFRHIKLQGEVDADKFVIKYGRAEDLNNFIDKLLKNKGNRIINRNSKELDDDIKTVINWSIENIRELEYRKSKLRNSLTVEALKTPSKYVKKVLDDIKSVFFGKDSENFDEYKMAMSEQYLIQYRDKIVTESIIPFFDKLGKIKKIKQSDIDVISMEIDKIESHDDRLYAIDLIYDMLDTVNLGLEYIERGKSDKVSQSKNTLKDYKQQLDAMRDKVMKINIPEKQYGLFVKYPKGYEG